MRLGSQELLCIGQVASYRFCGFSDLPIKMCWIGQSEDSLFAGKGVTSPPTSSLSFFNFDRLLFSNYLSCALFKLHSYGNSNLSEPPPPTHTHFFFFQKKGPQHLRKALRGSRVHKVEAGREAGAGAGAGGTGEAPRYTQAKVGRV